MPQNAGSAQPVPSAFWGGSAAHLASRGLPQVHQVQLAAPMFVWVPVVMQTDRGGCPPPCSPSTASEGPGFADQWSMTHCASLGSQASTDLPTRRGSSESLASTELPMRRASSESLAWTDLPTRRGSSESLASIELPVRR